MDARSFTAVRANGWVHLTVHHADHPDHTIRMLETDVPHLLETLEALAAEEAPAKASD